MLPDIVSGWPRVLQQKLDYGENPRSLGLYARSDWIAGSKLAPLVISWVYFKFGIENFGSF